MAQEINIRSVWASNLDEEFKLISDCIKDYPFVAMDSEYPGRINKDPRHYSQFTPPSRYEYLKLDLNVDKLKLIQVGLTLFDSNGNLPIIDECPCLWEFNMRDFNVEEDKHDKEAIELLKRRSIDFKKFRDLGLELQDFGALMTSSGLVMNHDVAWVAFDSLYDFGYLTKMLRGGEDLPKSLGEFLNLVKVYFGDEIYDVKYMGSHLELKGGLKTMGKSCGVERVVGEEHNAGSDSHLTMQVFMKMKAHEKFKDGMGSVVGVIGGTK